ncbi:MAG: hypothetical protein L0H59_03585 [Tomitella sp.]|nr:hypothetical protein [Tomitella sp.]
MPPHTGPIPAESGGDPPDAELRKRIAQLHAQIDSRSSTITDATERRNRTAAAHQAARADYRSTPAGLSASLRDLERALLAGRPAREIRTLQHAHVRAELAAAREYRERAGRWGHRPGDGPLMACPIGADGPFATWMLNLAITGTYRYAPTRADATVIARLTRPGRGRRVERARITVPVEFIGREGLTLRSALTHAASRPEQQVRLRRIFGAHTEPVLAALTDDPPTV